MKLKMKLRCLCIARASPCVPVFSAKSSSSSSSSASMIKYGNKYGNIENGDDHKEEEEDGSVKDDDVNNNKIMVVVNSSIEAKGALDWALSHAVQAHDTLILLHVPKPSSSIQDAESTGKLNLKTHQLLVDMKNLCETKKPGVEVKVVKVEGRREEKGRAIVAEAKQRKISLLIIGQRKRPILWCIMRRLGRKRRSNTTTTTSGLAEYCIQNASCMTIAVRRKNKKLGGYLITTKRHKNFWLLA